MRLKLSCMVMKQGVIVMYKRLKVLVTLSLNYTQDSYSRGANERGGFSGSSSGGGVLPEDMVASLLIFNDKFV